MKVIKFISLLIVVSGLFFFQSCVQVKPYQREVLSDPIMQRIPDKLEQGLKSHNLPRREGSTGGSSGSGGGCGC